MEDLFRTIAAEAARTPLLEWVAVCSSLLYIGLATRENSLCWYPAMLASICFGVLLFQADLYMKVPLRGYYLVMAFYGLYEWRKGGKGGTPLPIRTLPPRYHLLGIAFFTMIGLLFAYGFSRWTDASMPYLDGLTTVFSLFTTWLVARKYLENWLYWIVIDGASIQLYASQDLYLTALLYLLFTLMAIYGAIDWGKRYLREKAEA